MDSNFVNKGQSRNLGKKVLTQLKSLLLCQCHPEIIGMSFYSTVDLDKARVGRTRMVTDCFVIQL
ncbi:unnamed protein product [Lupinus luteus]|uniref:Uncharacterized protein n=1 Tax=Lupinus luteus TaxID=3873 RepID=A0AAV1YMG8_LUPLU